MIILFTPFSHPSGFLALGWNGPEPEKKWSSGRAPGRAPEAPRDICGEILGTPPQNPGRSGEPRNDENGATTGENVAKLRFAGIVN